MSKRALVVDNDFFFVEFLSELLETRGYVVVKAYDGKEGVTKLDEGPFDVLFVDLVMPKISGHEFIKTVRHRFADSPCPIVAVSGALMEQMDDLTDIGADHYVAKGALEQMTQHVEAFLARLEGHPVPLEKARHLVELNTAYSSPIAGELIESLNFQKAVTESLGFGIMVVDRDARVIHANEHTLGILHQPLGHILNKPVPCLFPPVHRGMVMDALRHAAKNPADKRACVHAVVNDRSIRLIVSLLRLAGKVAGWVVAMEELGQDVDPALEHDPVPEPGDCSPFPSHSP